MIQSNPNCTDEEKLLQSNVAAAATVVSVTSEQTSTEDFDLNKRSDSLSSQLELQFLSSLMYYNNFIFLS